MGNKILENSRLISFIIEFIMGLAVGTLLIIFFVNLGYHYFAKPNKKSKHIVSNKKTGLSKNHKAQNVSQDKFISQFYNTLALSPQNIQNYLSVNFRNYLSTTYGSTNYSDDIKSLLSLNVFPQKINFYANFSNYSTVYVNVNSTVVYFNIYFAKIGNSYIVTDITLSEG
ncbi:hypothetical protein M1145_02840 [Patescibacteria group bacterium]|nr:hypothetical protein [Patescibacteria group bacterium]